MPPADGTDPAELLRRHERWSGEPVHATIDDLRRRLARDGITLEEYGHLSAGVELPPGAARQWPWVAFLEGICRDWEDLQRADDLPANDAIRPWLATLTRPFALAVLRGVRHDLTLLRAGDARGVLAAGDLDVQLLHGLGDRLQRFASPVTVLELHVVRIESDLADTEVAEAARLFQRRLAGRGGVELLRAYPLLARTLAELSLQHLRNAVELARRARDDAGLLSEVFAGGADIGALAEVGKPLGDPHGGGRTVRRLGFSGGCQVVYKPRCLAIDLFVADFLRWLGSKSVTAPQRAVIAVDRGSYGWAEVVEPQPCDSAAAVERFYRRQGGLLAVCYLLAASDLHSENLVAAGECPVAVDLEGFVQAPLPRAGDGSPARGRVHELVGTGLLPRGPAPGEGAAGPFDVSGIAGTGGVWPVHLPRLSSVEQGLRYVDEPVTVPAHANLPEWDGRRVAPRAHAGALEAGFREVCEVVSAHAGELVGSGGLLDQARGLPVRAFLRPTHVYDSVLTAMAHPDLMRDGLDRERLLDSLWPRAAPTELLAAACPAERRALLDGDVPAFGMLTDDVEVTADGARIGVAASRSGLSEVEERIKLLDADQVDDLCWVLRACIATTAGRTGGPRWPTMLCRGGGSRAVHPDALRGRAAAIAGLVNRRVEQGRHGVAWLGLRSESTDWSFGHLDTGLYDGTAGIVVFLAYAGASTGERAFTARARDGVDAIRRSWEAGAAAEARGAQRMPADRLGGAFGPLGGSVLALAHLAVLWERAELGREALAMCAAAEQRVDEIEENDLVGGVGGLLAAALTLHDVVGDPALLRLAVRCGELLAARARPRAGGLAWASGGQYLAGFSHGAAGIVAVLARLARATGDVRWSELAARGCRFEDSLFSERHGNWRDARPRADGAGPDAYPLFWCHGAPGIALGRAILMEGARDTGHLRDLEIAVRTTAGTATAHTHCLCHGSLGNLLTLRRCASLGYDLGELGLDGTGLDGHVAGVLETVDRHGLVCGLPDGVFGPDLMIGAAGIGYALLAFADPGLPSLVGLDDLPA